MRLNNLRPAAGTKKNAKRVGRGVGSGTGKTCGRGIKGQKSRSGGFTKTGFEGGQMPLQRRLPKRGFRSRKALTRAEVRLDALNAVEADQITLLTLQEAGVLNGKARTAKIILAGEITKAVNVAGLPVSKGARAAIEAAGGSVSE